MQMGTFLALFAMNLDWLPGLAAGIGAGLVGSGLVMWKQAAVTEERIGAMKEASKKEMQALERRLEESSKNAHDSDGEMSEELKQACKDLHQIAGDFKALVASQSVINDVVNKALASVVLKLEHQQAQLNDHSASITVLRELVLSKKT
jgi:hypothetical protein